MSSLLFVCNTILQECSPPSNRPTLEVGDGRRPGRRAFLIAVGTGMLAAPLAALAQQRGKVWRIGFFYFASRQSALEAGRYDAFLQGMRELGYAEGKHFVIEARYADSKPERIAGLATELVRLKVDVIVATGTNVYQALSKAKSTIPTVMTVGSDPVGDGYAASLARPGGNFTGMSTVSIDLTAKRVELLTTVIPRLSRLAVLIDPVGSPTHPAQLKNVMAAARKFGIQVMPVEGQTPEGIERGFATMTPQRAEAVFVLTSTFFVQQSKQIAGLALKHRLPSMFGTHEYVDSGGLMSYGQDIRDNFRRAAGFVDKILKGSKPGDLPIEQPTKFHLVINGKTAKALGITIPQSILLQADRVIE